MKKTGANSSSQFQMFVISGVVLFQNQKKKHDVKELNVLLNVCCLIFSDFQLVELVCMCVVCIVYHLWGFCIYHRFFTMSYNKYMIRVYSVHNFPAILKTKIHFPFSKSNKIINSRRHYSQLDNLIANNIKLSCSAFYLLKFCVVNVPHTHTQPTKHSPNHVLIYIFHIANRFFLSCYIKIKFCCFVAVAVAVSVAVSDYVQHKIFRIFFFSLHFYPNKIHLRYIYLKFCCRIVNLMMLFLNKV